MTQKAQSNGAPCLAAITLDSRGGGVAAVSRLMWRAMRERWDEDASLVTLVDADLAPVDLSSSTAARVRFGATLARMQTFGHCPWVMYSHIGVARVQSYIPPMFRRPHAVFVHGIEAWHALPSADLKNLQGATIRIANSAYTAKRLREANPTVGPIEICPLAWLPIETADPGVRKVPSLGPHVVLVVGRMLEAERYKGHDQLLEAWPTVLQQVPDARLVFVGDGDDVDRLRAKAAATTSRVTIAGFVSDADLVAMYDAAAVFAMPSRGEGFGLVYLEAMSHRLPCIASTHDAASEIVQDGVTGFLVDQADTTMLADRIVRLLSDPAARREMGQRGYQRLHAEFTYGRFAARLIGLLDGAFGSVARPVGVPTS